MPLTQPQPGAPQGGSKGTAACGWHPQQHSKCLLPTTRLPGLWQPWQGGASRLCPPERAPDQPLKGCRPAAGVCCRRPCGQGRHRVGPGRCPARRRAGHQVRLPPAGPQVAGSQDRSPCHAGCHRYLPHTPDAAAAASLATAVRLQLQLQACGGARQPGSACAAQAVHLCRRRARTQRGSRGCPADGGLAWRALPAGRAQDHHAHRRAASAWLRVWPWRCCQGRSWEPCHIAGRPALSSWQGVRAAGGTCWGCAALASQHSAACSWHWPALRTHTSARRPAPRGRLLGHLPQRLGKLLRQGARRRQPGQRQARGQDPGHPRRGRRAEPRAEAAAHQGRTAGRGREQPAPKRRCHGQLPHAAPLALPCPGRRAGRTSAACTVVGRTRALHWWGCLHVPEAAQAQGALHRHPAATLSAGASGAQPGPVHAQPACLRTLLAPVPPACISLPCASSCRWGTASTMPPPWLRQTWALPSRTPCPRRRPALQTWCCCATTASRGCPCCCRLRTARRASCARCV